jgi:hypothetical protein
MSQEFSTYYPETPLLRRNVRGSRPIGLPFFPHNLIENLFQNRETDPDMYKAQDRSESIGDCWIQTPDRKLLEHLFKEYQATGTKTPMGIVTGHTPTQRMLSQGHNNLIEGLWLLIYQYPHHFMHLKWKRGNAFEALLDTKVRKLPRYELHHRCATKRVHRGTVMRTQQTEFLGYDTHVLGRCANPAHMYLTQDAFPIKQINKEYEFNLDAFGSKEYETLLPNARRHIRKLVMTSKTPARSVASYLHSKHGAKLGVAGLATADLEEVSELLFHQVLVPQQQYWLDTWMGSIETKSLLTTYAQARRWMNFTMGTHTKQYPQWFLDHVETLKKEGTK